MPLQTYTIELKLVAGENQHDAMTEITKQYARDLLASAMLLSPEKRPQVACRVGDSFFDTQEIEFLDPSGGGDGG